MSYLMSIYSDEKSTAAVLWHCFKAYKLGDEVWDVPEGTEGFSVAINKAQRITVVEAVKDVSGTGIQDVVEEYDLRAIVTNQLSQTKSQLYGTATYHKPQPGIAEGVSAYHQMTRARKLRMGKGTAALTERFEQQHYDHPSVRAFCLGLVFVPLFAFPVFGYTRCYW